MGKIFFFVFSAGVLLSYNLFSIRSRDMPSIPFHPAVIEEAFAGPLPPLVEILEPSVVVQPPSLQHVLSARDMRMASIISSHMVDYMNYEGLGKYRQKRQFNSKQIPELEVYARAFSDDVAKSLLDGDATLSWKIGVNRVASLWLDKHCGTWHYRQLERINR